MHHESISVKNFIVLKLRMFSPANLSVSTVDIAIAILFHDRVHVIYFMARNFVMMV